MNREVNARREELLETAAANGHSMLVLNMALFNFTDGWNRAFSRDQYARFSV